MRVKKIILSGFKRFHKLTIDLGEIPKRIIALVGPNGCGKSSVLDSMMYKQNTHSIIGKYIDLNTLKDIYSLDKDPQFDSSKVEIYFDTGEFYKIAENKNKAGKAKTIFSYRGPFRYNQNVKISEIKTIPSIAENSYGAGYSNDIDDKVTQNYKLLYNKYYRIMNENDLKPSETKKIVLDELNQYIGKCLDLAIVDMGDIQSGRGTLYFNKSDQKKEFEFNVLSSGEKEVVDIILDLYLRKDDYDETIYLIDEPELHINTAIQRKLLEVINEIIPNNCQIWIATHSIGFLRALQNELKEDTQIIEFNANNKWAEQEYSLQPKELKYFDWLELFSTALDDLANLITPKLLIYCEGKDVPTIKQEEQGLDAKIYNNIFNKKYTDVLFVSSGGNTELEQRKSITLKILSKALKDLQILILKDRDCQSGKQVSINDRQKLLDDNSSLRILNRYEIENYLYDKEILKKYCNKYDLNFDEEKYDEIVNDVINDNIKDITGEIKEVCGIKFPISKDKFKILLSDMITEETQVFNELEKCIFF